MARGIGSFMGGFEGNPIFQENPRYSRDIPSPYIHEN